MLLVVVGFFIQVWTEIYLSKYLQYSGKDIPRKYYMGLLSEHESIVWNEFHKGKSTGDIANESLEEWSPSYVSRVLTRTREKISNALKYMQIAIVSTLKAY